MKATSNIDVINKYNPKRIEYDGKKKIEKSNYYCQNGEELEILTENAGSYCVVVIARNKIGESFVVRWDEIKIIEEKEIEFDF